MGAIFLVGFMGCGKSAIARHLARELKLPLVDLDSYIESQVGTSIADFFATHGEEAFREAETAALREVSTGTGVISLGGGAPTREENREILKSAARRGALVVYLQAHSSTLATRIRRQPGKRPLIDGAGHLDLAATRKRVEELLAQRGPMYEEVANVVVRTDDREVPVVAQQVAREWHTRETQENPGK